MAALSCEQMFQLRSKHGPRKLHIGLQFPQHIAEVDCSQHAALQEAHLTLCGLVLKCEEEVSVFGQHLVQAWLFLPIGHCALIVWPWSVPGGAILSLLILEISSFPTKQVISPSPTSPYCETYDGLDHCLPWFPEQAGDSQCSQDPDIGQY